MKKRNLSPVSRFARGSNDAFAETNLTREDERRGRVFAPKINILRTVGAYLHGTERARLSENKKISQV